MNMCNSSNAIITAFFVTPSEYRQEFMGIPYFFPSLPVRDHEKMRRHRVWDICMCPVIGYTYKSAMAGNTNK